jgi:uncharacterized membrane protein
MALANPAGINFGLLRTNHVRLLRRITGTLDTFVISFIVTGRATIAGSIAATELLTKIALYYGHERVWAAIHWGRH